MCAYMQVDTVRMLLKAKVDANCRSYLGLTPLQLATTASVLDTQDKGRCERKQQIGRLLREGVVGCPNGCGHAQSSKEVLQNDLRFACKMFDRATIECVLRHGANPSLSEKESYTFGRYGQGYKQHTPLSAALTAALGSACPGDHDFHLFHSGPKVSHTAEPSALGPEQEKHCAIIRLLLESKADTTSGNMANMWAIAGRTSYFVEFLTVLAIWWNNAAFLRECIRKKYFDTKTVRARSGQGGYFYHSINIASRSLNAEVPH